MVKEEQIDVLLLQETKLQEQHVAEVEPVLLDVLEAAAGAHWRAAWACSTARKGYAGVSTLWSDRMLGEHLASSAVCAPFTVDPGHEAEREGRTLLLRLPIGSSQSIPVVNVYTPNSGAQLKRLDYRCGAGGWDAKFRDALAAVLDGQQAASHLCIGGDFNVAVEDADFFNPEEPRMAKQAGTTPRERASFREYADGPLRLVDGFRTAHPDARGQYTYWSQRARNRPRNRGLRLDYFLLSSWLTRALVDVQHMQHVPGSDHCPVLLQIDLEQLRDPPP